MISWIVYEYCDQDVYWALYCTVMATLFANDILLMISNKGQIIRHVFDSVTIVQYSYCATYHL